MKKLTVILLIAICLTTQAQVKPNLNRTVGKVNMEYIYTPSRNSYKVNNKEAWKSILLNTAAVASAALGDGFLDEGKSQGNVNLMYLGHSLKAVSVGVLLSKPLIQNLDTRGWILDIISYGFIRAGSFDEFYNVSRGLPIGTVGSTCIWDKFWGATKSPEEWILGSKALFLTVGFVVPIKEF